MAPNLWPSDLEISFKDSVSQQDWDIGEDPARNIFDAVVLEDITRFGNTQIERVRRVRILSENGKAAADLVDFAGKVTRLKGRVVDISGQVTRFEQKEDFVEVLAFRSRRTKQKSKYLLPPGLTSDCVVEVSWRQQAEGGLPKDSYGESYLVQEPYHCIKKEFQIEYGANKSPGYLVTRYVWTNILPPAKFEERKEKNGETVVTYREVPPVMDFPYGNRHLDRNTAYFLAYLTFPDYSSEHDSFWKEFSRSFAKQILDVQFGRSKDYKDWLKELKNGLPEDPLMAAIAVHKALAGRVSSTELMPPEKKVDLDDKDLSPGKSFDLGYASPHERGQLFYKTLSDLKIPFKVYFPTSVYGPKFDSKALNPFDLYLNAPLIALDRGNSQMVLFSPQWPEYPPGFIPPHLQGGPALVVDPDNRWQCNFANSPRFGPEAHKVIRQYQLKITPDGTIDLEVSEEVSGVFEASLREDYLPIPQDERDEKLQRVWQNRISTWQIESAVVSNAEDFEKKIGLRVQAKETLELDRLSWIALQPFPGSTQPLSSPEIWPDNRTQPILLPHCSTYIDLATISLPQGWVLRGDSSWQKENDVGLVRYVAVQKDNAITVRRDIVLKQDLMPADKERDLKYFLAWMEEASRQNIGITKGDGP